jgi:RNA polymerase sigma-70 factor (ECF subfamily)
MDERKFLAEQFEATRAHLTRVAYRMLGSHSEAGDAVQEAWLRLSRTDTSNVENLGGWLTTVVARVCLDMLRMRRARREETLDALEFAPATGSESGIDPEQDVLMVGHGASTGACNAGTWRTRCIPRHSSPSLRTTR